MIKMKTPFYPADILIPENADMQKWSVVACDQYTSEPDYWKRVESFVGGAPSTLKMILPEIYLEAADSAERIEKINKTMRDYLKEGLFKCLQNSFVYVERTLPDGKVRKGIIGAVDLEEYDYSVGSRSLIRATEGTIISRIPPRLKVRKNAALESPHILILIDDKEKTVIEREDKSALEKIYDFDLMENSGHIAGYLIKDTAAVLERFNALSEKVDRENPLFFAVGDGNHSLATAKAHWEELKKTLSPEELRDHPARYALAEIENLHDDSLVFEPIHRVVFDCDEEDLIKELKSFYDISENGGGQKITIVKGDKKQTLFIKDPKSSLPVGSLQIFLDKYIAEKGLKTDYIHGDDVVGKLSEKKGNLGFILPAMDKSELFPTVMKDGALPRKTFSMGEACEKRFYLEMRKIVKDL